MHVPEQFSGASIRSVHICMHTIVQLILCSSKFNFKLVLHFCLGRRVHVELVLQFIVTEMRYYVNLFYYFYVIYFAIFLFFYNSLYPNRETFI